MKVTYPISTDDGDEYLVLIESFEKSILPDDIIEMLNNIEIVDNYFRKSIWSTRNKARYLV